MVKLFCAVVGVESVFSVDINSSETVDDLKVKIKVKEEYGFPASKLKLCLAREGSDTWLNSRDSEIKALKKGEIRMESRASCMRNCYWMELRGLMTTTTCARISHQGIETFMCS